MTTGVTLLLDGHAIPVTHMFDISGDDVDQWDEAYTFVAGPLPDGKWLSAPVADYRVKKLS